MRLLTAMLLGSSLFVSIAGAAEPLLTPLITQQPQSVEKVSSEQVQAALSRGFQWLQDQQTAEGSWPSETYGTLRGGLATSALSLATLAELRNQPHWDRKRWQQGVRFLSEHVDSEGLLRQTGGDSDHPIYTTALFLAALTSVEEQAGVQQANQQLIQKLREGLLKQQRNLVLLQVDSAENFPDEAGGWGPGRLDVGEGRLPTSPANISVTFHVLQALETADGLTPEVQRATLKFVRNCQSSEQGIGSGGFVFTLQPEHPLNKAGWQLSATDQKVAIPYYSATCDGLLSLRLCGLAESEREVKAALAFLERHQLPPYPVLPLSSEELTELNLQALYFYHIAALSRVWQQLTFEQRKSPEFRTFRQQCLQTLIEYQQPEGSWRNPLSGMMEDDPLIATSFALQALQRWTCDEPALEKAR